MSSIREGRTGVELEGKGRDQGRDQGRKKKELGKGREGKGDKSDAVDLCIYSGII